MAQRQLPIYLLGLFSGWLSVSSSQPIGSMYDETTYIYRKRTVEWSNVGKYTISDGS